MDKRLLVATVAAMASPAMGGVEVVRREPSGGLGDWLRANGKIAPKGRRPSKDPSRYAGRGFVECPKVDLPGYFWKQDAAGPHWRLYRQPPLGTTRKVEYDKFHDRSIIRSAWGYVKPTYAFGDVR